MQNFVYAMLMVQSSYRQAIQKKLRELGVDITFEMLQVIRCLHRKDGINQQELAKLTYKDKSSLSYLLNNMEKRGFISRIEDKNDKRNKLILFTDQGKEIHNQVKTAIDVIYDNVEKNIAHQKLEICVEYMKELSDIINNG